MKKVIYALVCCLCVSLFTVGCSKDEVVVTCTIRGFVSDYSSANTPIAGATVTINSKGLSKTTGSDGRFEFTDLDQGTYSIAVSANNYQTTTKQVTVYTGQSANCDFQLEKSSANVEISPLMLTFGQNVDQLSFSIRNNGNQALVYSISDAPDYIEVSPASGTAAAKSSQAITVRVKNRNSITTARSGLIKVNIGNDSETVHIAVDAYSEMSASVSVDPKTLTFDKNTELLTFTMTSSYAQDLAYKIDSDLDILTVTPTEGKLAANSKMEISVRVRDRKKVTENCTGALTVTVGNNTYVVSVNVDKYDEAVSVEIQPASLTFDKDTDRLSFKMISNNNIDFAYNISSDLNFLTITPNSGMLVAGGSVDVSVSISNRKSVTTDRTGAITISVGGNTYTIPVSVDKYEDGGSQGGGNEGGGSDGGIVVPNGLYAYFTFEDNIEDITETALSGTGIGTSYVSSYNGTKALNIPGNGSAMLSIPDGLVDQREMSISFWVKDLYDGHVFHAVRSYDNSSAFLLAVENGRLKFIATRYDIGYQYSACPSFVNGSLDGWHMITIVSDFNKTAFETVTTRLYVDGSNTDVITEYDNPFSESVSEGMPEFRNYNACTKFVMGGSLTGKYEPNLSAAKIVIDNLRIYKNRRLSNQEIKTIYNAEKR